MSVQQTTCPEPGCEEKTTAWAGGFSQHQTERDYERACPKHKAKYRKLRDEWKEQLERLNRL